MLGIYLSLALGLSRVPGSTTEDTGSYLCDTSIDGDVCESKGMAVYVTYSNPPSRPGTFYPVSPAQWDFNAANILKYLGVSSSSASSVSPKFSGVFTPSKTGMYTFKLSVQHTMSASACSLVMGDYDFFIDADLSYSGTGTSYGLSCSFNATKNGSSCIEYNYCSRQYYFVADDQYPIYAGARSNFTVPQTNNLWMALTYTDPSSNSLDITDEAVAGLSEETESEDVLSSKESSTVLIGGVCAGVVVVVVIASVAGWIVIRKATKKDKHSNSDATNHREYSGGYTQRISGLGVKEGGNRHGSGRSSRQDSRAGSGDSSRKKKERKGRRSKKHRKSG